MPDARPEVLAFFHKATWTMTYLVADTATRRAALIDPALDYDPASGRTATHSADEVIAAARARGWTLDWILETHAHADHLSAAQHVKRALGGKVAIGQGITAVQGTFVKVFGLEGEVVPDGSQFDHLFRDGERFQVGGIGAEVLHTPGHTDDSVTYLIGDAAFVGDTMFMPDGGTARCDSPAAPRAACTARSSASWRSRRRRGSSCATTTSRAAASCATRRPSPRSAPRTCT